ncbi:hypothetical protein D3OALGA1CA_1776 [Olavius algarvensis associated proteobacterium Delta 3]|nr:hypothetical protein D3OALGA1CA_1776 [Olavius algarvensis associated proteobacterium Delta 3]CAB5136849.1 hypothetical protein D3OALGB2SA_3988 [Olavius algarvensis associated proteobacterium Delta 3]
MSEAGGQTSGDRRQKAEDRCRMTETRGQDFEDYPDIARP